MSLLTTVTILLMALTTYLTRVAGYLLLRNRTLGPRTGPSWMQPRVRPYHRHCAAFCDHASGRLTGARDIPGGSYAFFAVASGHYQCGSHCFFTSPAMNR
jgi:hypothetical protein